MTVDLSTTNVLLGIMAVASALQIIGLLAMIIGGVLVVRRLRAVIDGIESRQIAPAAARLNAILDDVHDVTSSVKHGVGHMGGSLQWIARLVSRRVRAD
jgi:sensor histidine kinase regulating citrate/malate metabolism